MPGNPHRGDTPIKVGNQDLILCYDLNACAIVMEELGVENFEDLTKTDTLMAKISMGKIIALLWAGLQHHHPDLTREEVGAMEWDLAVHVKKVGEAFKKGLVTQRPSRGPAPKKARTGDQ